MCFATGIVQPYSSCVSGAQRRMRQLEMPTASPMTSAIRSRLDASQPRNGCRVSIRGFSRHPVGKDSRKPAGSRNADCSPSTAKATIWQAGSPSAKDASGTKRISGRRVWIRIAIVINRGAAQLTPKQSEDLNPTSTHPVIRLNPVTWLAHSTHFC